MAPAGRIRERVVSGGLQGLEIALAKIIGVFKPTT